MDLKSEFTVLLTSAIKETGAQLKTSASELALYASERAAYLAGIANEPGFELAVKAERDAVALKAGISAVNEARAVDQRIVGIIHGALMIGARALATA